MKDTDITEPLFREAVDVLRWGNASAMKALLDTHPELVRDRLITPQEDGYFKDPYLLWFIADNPILKGSLPANIAEVAAVIIEAIKREAPDSCQFQLDYALGLVVTGRIPRECGVQIALMDLLIDEGATAGSGVGALAHGNEAAARHLIKRGGPLTLTTAVCLNEQDEVNRLLPTSRDEERQTALVAAAFYANTGMLTLLINAGVNVNVYPTANSGFHSHATALHQAVYSGSLEAVKLLTEAGADLSLPDKVYQGTPLGWAMYMQSEESPDDTTKLKYAAIEAYLRSLDK
ncbi:MAG: ankyrin repeat domain-containing protein [Chitinophagaceae bacterium]